MTGKTFSIICTIILMAAVGANLCVAQANDSQAITNWGQIVQGVQLAITMTNSVFQVGSSSAVESVTTNSSTNTIIVDISAPTMNFGVLLTNDTGKSCRVTPRLAIREPGRPVTISPGGELSESIPVIFGKNIEPGDYTLKATRTFTLNDKEFTLESN